MEGRNQCLHIYSLSIPDTCRDSGNISVLICSPSPPPLENKSSSAALFHTSLAESHSERGSDSSESGWRNEDRQCSRGVCEKCRGGEADLSRTNIPVPALVVS